MACAEGIAGKDVDVFAIIVVEPRLHSTIRVFAECLCDDVDDTADRLGAIEESLSSLDHFDALDHVCRQRIERCGSVVQAVADPNAIYEPENLVDARTLKRRSDIVERAGLRSQEQARHKRLQCL